METIRESSRSAMWSGEQAECQSFPISEDDREGHERLKKLYPCVNEKVFF